MRNFLLIILLFSGTYLAAQQPVLAYKAAETADSLRLPPIQLSTVTIAAVGSDPYRAISKIDIRLRGINNSQEVLRMVPGLFIGQHAGGGKAEQIFLRGFDLDHGTDISISVDGMPVNMVSHAHGQGYADLHFLIPELIQQVNFRKGSYYAEKGNFNTTGFVDFSTYDRLQKSMVKLEAGQYNTFRMLGMFDLLSEKQKEKDQSAYIASEYMYTDGYFQHPQAFNRFNLFGKYHGRIDKHNMLSLSGSIFSSNWNASGQIPDRAVREGLVKFYGAIDPNEGGKTSRTNANTLLITTLNNGDFFRNQVYFSDYHFQLYSNFTFYKIDTVNGDQIRQKERRGIWGYNGSYHRQTNLGSAVLRSELGVQYRMDQTRGTELSRTKDRINTTASLELGDIFESNLSFYASETITLSSKFNINAGLRYDIFRNRYHDALATGQTGNAGAATLSPKLSFNYRPNDKVQFYLSNGKGFHSNDTRVVVPENGLNILPPSYGSDLGMLIKPIKNLLFQTALWYLWLDQEFVYVGDEAIIEPGGRTKRYGMDIMLRYQPLKRIYIDLDVNYSHGRAVDNPKGSDLLPLAPKITSIGGLTYKSVSGFSASLRYRYMSDRPANADNSLVAKGYFIKDAFLNYTKKKYEIGISVQNLFNEKWKETQFDTESRLRNEPAPISEIHFTPGTPLFVKLSLAVMFR